MQDSKFSIDQTIGQISNFAPVVLFIVMVMIFSVTGYLQKEYYSTIFLDVLDDTQYIAFLFPVIVQTLRLVTGFLSASFFKKKKYFLGVCVFLFSLWLTVFEHNEAAHMGQFWTVLDIDLSTVTQMQNTKLSLVRESITIMVRILIWSALVLEFFLAFWLGMKTKKDNELDESILPKNGKSFSSNGQSKSKKANAQTS